MSDTFGIAVFILLMVFFLWPEVIGTAFGKATISYHEYMINAFAGE